MLNSLPAGYHRFGGGAGCYEAFEVTPEQAHQLAMPGSGWYWWLCQPGGVPETQAAGPFGSEFEARAAAEGFWNRR